MDKRVEKKLPSSSDTCNVVAAEWGFRSSKVPLIRDTPMECRALANSSHPYQNSRKKEKKCHNNNHPIPDRTKVNQQAS